MPECCGSFTYPPGARELTRRQGHAYKYLWVTVRDRGYPPTMRELGDHIGLRSTSSVAYLLMALVEKGWITRGHGPRAITLNVELAEAAHA